MPDALPNLVDDLAVSPDEHEVPALQQLADAVDGADRIFLQVESGEPIALPRSAREAITRVLTFLAHGSAVVIDAADTLMTTQEAADFLGISRPHLISLLDHGEIPYQRPGSQRAHRRIAFRDIVSYAERIASRPAPMARRRVSIERSAVPVEPLSTSAPANA